MKPMHRSGGLCFPMLCDLKHDGQAAAQEAAEERAAACGELRSALETEQRAWLEAQRERAAEEAAALEARLRDEANGRRDAEIKVRADASFRTDVVFIHLLAWHVAKSRRI